MCAARSWWRTGFARGRERFALGLALVACAACASFSESRLPRRELSDLIRDGKLPEVTYELSEGPVLAGLEDWSQTGTAAVFASVLQPRMEPIFRRAFADAVRQPGPGEWHVDVYYRETERNPAVSFTLALFFITSLGVVPAYLQEDLYLEAKLKHHGETVRQLVFEESVTTWIHWFVLPWSFSDDPIERKAEILDNMILNLLFELKSDMGAVAE